MLCYLKVLFARAEALHAHGQTREACRLAQRLAEELLTNPPDLLAETANLPSLKGNTQDHKYKYTNIHVHFYAPGLKGPPGASSNWIVHLSVCLSLCLSVCP